MVELSGSLSRSGLRGSFRSPLQPRAAARGYIIVRQKMQQSYGETFVPKLAPAYNRDLKRASLHGLPRRKEASHDQHKRRTSTT